MILLSLSLDTLGLLVRVWLWLSVPVTIIVLAVATWLNFRRNTRNVRLGGVWPGMGGRPGQGEMRLEPGGGLSGGEFILAVEGWEGEGSGVGDGAGEGFVGSGDVVGHGEAVRHGVEGDVGLGEDSEEFEAMGGTGKETIYRGILWMKEKYEQYREQADRRYELLRDELGRSERRYQELLLSAQQQKGTESETVMGKRQSALVEGEGAVVAVGGNAGVARGENAEATVGGEVERTADQLVEVRSLLSAKQAIIDELEIQLRSERMKVEELVGRIHGLGGKVGEDAI